MRNSVFLFSRRLLAVGLVSVVGALSATAFAAPRAVGADPTAGYHEVWKQKLPVNGTEIASGPLSWSGPGTYLVVVTGVLDTGKLGAKYDGEYKAISASEFRLRHRFLRFGTPGWVNIHGHRRKHLYVYRLEAKVKQRPSRLRVSLDGIAYTFRVSPARLARESTSTLQVSLWKKGQAAPARSPLRWEFALVFAGFAVLIWLVIWVVRRRPDAPRD